MMLYTKSMILVLRLHQTPEEFIGLSNMLGL